MKRPMRSLLPTLGLAVLCMVPPAFAQRIHADGFENIGPADAEAARFLQQAAFGPTLSDIERVKQLGFEGWIEEQLALPASLTRPYVEWVDSVDHDAWQNNDARIEAWMVFAMGGADPGQPLFVHRDQLRQRVAFALSQLFVVSDRLAAIGSHPETMVDYYDLITSSAFGNYRELLEDVTLHPAMGHYLSMFRNRRPDALLGIRPDENYAREIMQLFSVGLVMLGPDGAPIQQSGVPVPTYNQDTIRGFAHVFTGWNWNGCSVNGGGWDFCPERWREPMQPMEAYHASAQEKQLLDYPGVVLPDGVLPAGGTADADLQAALDNLFHHPNVGPFVARHLIRQLVTSNPTPAYVAAVAQAFADNGAGVRGDLGAVVRAVLLHPEARLGHLAAPTTFGKLREPLLKQIALLRAMDARSASGRIDLVHPEMDFLQAPLRAPSVFNFFLANFAPPGEILDAGMVAPEFQLATESGMTSQVNAVGESIYWAANPSLGDGLAYDFARDESLADDLDALLDRYDLLFFAGSMSDGMRARLLTHAVSIPAAGDYRLRRIRDLVFLIANSPEFAVQK